MANSTLESLPIAKAQEGSGLGRSAFYKRLGQTGIEPIRVSGRGSGWSASSNDPREKMTRRPL